MKSFPALLMSDEAHYQMPYLAGDMLGVSSSPGCFANSRMCVASLTKRG